MDIIINPESTDTICAIATPHGSGGIAVVRLSGNDALTIADRVWQGRKLSEAATHTAHLGFIIDPAGPGTPLDQALATIMRAPRSYTGHDTVEFSIHGSQWIQQELLRLLIAAGARMAQPGEFTRRAFASGHLDLTEAEAVADLIASSSRAAHHIAMHQMRGGFSRRLTRLRDELLNLASLLELELDFSEEEVEFAPRPQLFQTATEILDEITRLHNSFRAGAAIKDGIPVAIVGPTNAGKSSLLNALLGDERAIVSDIHGTTRDTIEDVLVIGDHRFRLIDTAGLRATSDIIEQKGIDRTHTAIRNATIIINVIDPLSPAPTDLPTDLQSEMVNVINKADIATPLQLQTARDGNLLPSTNHTVEISALNHSGLQDLTDTLTAIANSLGGLDQNQTLITNARHAEALSEAADSLNRVIDGLNPGLHTDLIAQDLRQTLNTLGTITGAITTPDILTHIFSRFCIGK